MGQKKFKTTIGIFIILCFFSCGCVEEIPDQKDENTLYVNSNGTTQYSTIQHAIDEALQNNTIYVHAGVYHENLIINKSVVLRGEDNTKTVIDGNHKGDVIFIEETGELNISGFTIRNSGLNESPTNDAGIEIKSVNNSIMNNIFYNNTIGVFSSITDHNIIKNNIFDSNKQYGVYLFSGSNYMIITENIIKNNYCGLRIKGSQHNNVTRNIFINNSQGMYFCCGARLNQAYHNTFINNSIWNAYDYVGGNNWDGGYRIGGNYWDDYTGKDLYTGINQSIDGMDGFGDTPYLVSNDGMKKDNYPLIEPVKKL
jgi:parallel beta-helix repeat protein